MSRAKTFVRASAAAAALSSLVCSAQTPTQPISPGQTGTSGTSTQLPANATQPGTAAQQGSAGATIQTPGPRPGPGGSYLTGKAAPVPVLIPGRAVTLDQALALAQANEPAFAAAVAVAQSARLDRSIAKAALLPSVVYHNQFLYTQSNHTGTGNQIFLANNAIHEYVSQGQVTESLGIAQYNALARADAAAAIANAELEIGRRGLSATVIGLFYSLTTAAGKINVQQRAVQEAEDFVKQTTQREAEREVAHADVLKADLTLQQRRRDLADAQLLEAKSRLDLGVLLYPDPRTPYTVALPVSAPLPERATVEAAAKGNPEVVSALSSVRASSLGVTAARAAYLPSLVLNYSYGIDAPTFAINAPGNYRQLGYSASGTLDIPIFDWFATQHRVKQAQILRDAAKVTLSSAQRSLIANTESFYNEMRVAHDQLESLQATVGTARESLRLTRLRYSNGEGTVLEVVDAQNTLTLWELAFQDGTVRYQLALANLQILTGAF